MALTTLQKLAQARITGTPGNFARANTQAGIYTQPSGNTPYQKEYRDQTMYAPETFNTGHDAQSLALMQAKAKTMGGAQTGNMPLSFGDNVAKYTPSPVNTPTAPTTPAQTLASTFGMNSTTNNSTVNSDNTNVGIPEGMYANRAADGSTYYTYNNNGQMTNPGQTQPASSPLSDLDSRIKAMGDAISRRYEEMGNTARQVSGMNQSSIKGNLGRVFGANADTSEAAPVVTENSNLLSRLREIDTAKNEALSNLDMGALDRMQAEQSRLQQAQATQRQQDFNNAIAQAQLTGSYNGGSTMEAQNNALQRALQEAGVTGMYNGKQTMQGMSTLSGIQSKALEDALAKAGITGMYDNNPTLDALTKMSGVTGYFNGAPTLQRDQLDMGNQQKKLNDLMDYLASTSNNQNTNQTKITTTGMTGTNRLDLAGVNNAADLAQLLESLKSKESIASSNNSNRYDIASMNNDAKLSLLEQRLASGKGTVNDGKIYSQIIDAQAKRDALYNATFKIDPATGKSVQIRPFDSTEYDNQIANLISLSEKKN